MYRIGKKVSIGVLCALFALIMTFAVVFALAPNTSTAHAETEYTVVWDQNVIKTLPEYEENTELASIADAASSRTITMKSVNDGYIYHSYNYDYDDPVYEYSELHNSSVATGFTFSISNPSETTVTYFTKIEIKGGGASFYDTPTGSGWTGNDSGITWNGSALTVNFDVDGYVSELSEIKYTFKIIDGFVTTLNTNGGTINSGNVTFYETGVGATLPTDVTKNGYGFKGWYGNATFEGDPVTAIGTDATGAKEFWAKWLPTVTLNTNDGVINSGEITEYIEGVGATLPTDVTKENCTFGGWYDNATFDGEPVTAIGTEATGGKTYWAKWICTVTLNTNGGTINSGDVTEYAEGVGATLPTDVTKEDAFFAGWYDNASFEGDPVTTIGTNDRGPKEYWAKYLDHIHEYSSDWSYDDSKHWHACTSTKGVCDAPKIDEEEHSFDESKDTTAYYKCKCGYEDAERKDEFYNTAGTISIDTNKGWWSYTKHNVTINVNDRGDSDGSLVDDHRYMTISVKGNVVISRVTITIGYYYSWEWEGKGTPYALATAGSRSGNTFNNINAKTVKLSAPYRVFIKHIDVVTTPVNGITYELNGGTINEKIDVDYYDYYFDNQGRTLPSDVTRADYIFQGWYDNANFEGDPITAIPTGVTGNKTVWAKWKPTITYNVNGGEIQDAEYATEFTPGVGATLPTTVTKEGYSFGGWWNNETFEGDPVTETGTDVTMPQTYWARWYIIGYYFVGSVTDNKVEEEKLLIKNTAETETDEYYIDVRMSASDTFKVIYGTVVYGEEGRKYTLYPSGTGNEYVVPSNGLYRVFFRPNADGGAGWHENVLYAKRLFAEIGTDRYYSLAESFDAVSANGTIKLLDDVDLTSAAQLVVTKNVTIDLNGFILDITTSTDPKIAVNGGAVITIDDSSDDIGGVKGTCDVDSENGSYIVLGNCRLDMDAMLVRASVAINHKIEGYVVRDIDAGNPDADGFVTIVRPGTDEEIAADVDEWIGFIGEVQATVVSKTLIETARSEYEALTDTQKELVSDLATLEAAEGAYIALVVETIEALPEVGVLVYENKAAVENARDLYEALRDEEKDAFDAETLAVLEAAEADMEELKTAKAAEIAIVTLPSPGDLTFADCDDLVRARIRYDALTDYQRSKISEERHEELTAKLEALESEAPYCHAAEIVNVQIDALPLPEDIMPWNQSRIEAARAAYGALIDEEKSKVAQSTVDKLEAAEAALAAVVIDLAAATDVADVIGAIGFVEFTEESHDRIDSARTQYDALSGNQKRFVDNYATLTSAEAKYLQLKSDHDADETAAAIALIDAIGAVQDTPECAEKITAAREAFDALSAGQKEFVTNYATLEGAEIAYAAYTQVENVAKIEDDEYATFLAACEAARTGDTVKLMADIDLTGEVAAYITLRRDITIDLNGHVLDVTSAPLTYIVWASDGAIITIDNTVPERGGVKGILGADYRSGAGIVLHSCRLTLSIAELSKFDAFFSLDVDCVIADLNEGNPSVIGYSSIVYPIGDADYAAAVDGMIDAIGLVEYTDECQALIIAARDAYIALTDDQQLLVNNLATLEAAESNYATLAAAKIEALIADEITVVEKANIDAARAIYDSLNAQEKSYIGATFTKLHDAETTLAAIIAGYVANQEDCKHSLVQISSITGATTYSHDGTMRWYDYRDDEVLDGALGTRIHFPSNSGHNIAPGNVTVNMTAYLYEAREIEIWWKFEKGWCAQTDLTITSNTGSTTSRTIRLTQAYDGWNVEHISCPAGVSTFTFACSSQRPNTQVGTSGVDFYVIPQSYSMFGDGIICSQCGAVCKHESIGLAFDAETGEYYYVCNETYGCHHKVDLSTIPDEQESSFTSAREAYNALTDEQKALVIPSELLILEKHEAFKSVIENEQVAIQETNAVNNVIALLKKVPEAAEITVNDKTAIQAARTAYDALTEEQKALIEQTLLDKLTAAESKYAELKEEDDTQKADAVTNVITALPAVDDITFENRSLIEQARVAYEMLTSDQKAKITSETRNVLGAAETRGIIVSWEDFFPEDGTYILVPVTDDTKAMASNIKIAAYNESTINDNLTNNRNGKWKIVRQGGNVYYAIYSIYDVTYNNNDRLLDAAGWDSSLSDGTNLGLVRVGNGKSEYDTNVFRFSKRKGVDMEEDEYYIRAVSTTNNRYNLTVTLRTGDSINIGTYVAKNGGQVWKLVRVKGDEEFAKEVIDKIAALPTYNDVALDDESDIVAVREAYTALNEYQKTLVSNLAYLVSAEQKIVDIKAANAVDDKITAIGTVEDTAASKAKVDEVRAAYNAITDAQRLLVTKLDTLVAAETEIAGFVTVAIEAIPASAEITIDDKTAINAARAKYEALTPEEKTHVTQETVDKLSAAEVTITVISLPTVGVLTLENKAAVVAARAEYTALTDGAKEVFGVLETLVAAETEIADIEAAKAVTDAITALPEIADLTVGDSDAVMEVVTAYNALSPYQKDKVPADKANKLFAEKMSIVILALPPYDDITLEHETVVNDAYGAYLALPDDQRQLMLVDVTTKITSEKKKIDDMNAAKAVTTLIEAIGEVKYTDESKDKIDTARKQYNELTDEQEAFVTAKTLTILTDAEKEYAKEANEAIYDKLSKDVDDLTDEDKEYIAEAKATYDDLTDEEKDLIPQDTKDKLFTSVTTIAVLEILDADGVDENITDEDANKIKAAKEMYDDLTNDQKRLVPEDAVNKVLASAVTLDIVELTDTDEITIDDKTDILAAKEAFDALTPDQQDLIPQTKKDVLEASVTTVAIVEIPVATDIDEDITDEEANKIKAAKESYDDLTPEQQALVPEEVVNKVFASDAVLTIVELTDTDEISPEDKEAIEAARAKYNSLTGDQKDLIPSDIVDTLIASEAVLNIVELPVGTDITTEDKTDIQAARTAYNDLTPEQKEKVTQDTVNTLIAAETTLTIVELPENKDITAEDEDAIVAAREAYEGLEAGPKAKVAQGTVDTLIAAETTLKIVKLPAIEDVTVDDKAAILAVKAEYDGLTDDQKAKVAQGSKDKLFVSEATIAGMEIIDAADVDDDITDEDANKIKAAKALYDNLSDEQKDMMPDTIETKVLVSMTTLAIIKLPNPEDVTADNADAVMKARELYNALTDDQKAMISQENKDKLLAATTTIVSISVPEAKNVNEDITKEDADAIKAAKKAYDDLTDEQKEKVPEDTRNKLLAASAALDIVELPDTDKITANDKDAIEKARKAYKELDDTQKGLIPQGTVDTLIASEAVLEIVELPVGTDITTEDKTDIQAARAKYDDLTPEQKEKVPQDTVDTLVAAEAVLDIVELPVGTDISTDDKTDIQAARAAFEELSEDQKKKVPQDTVDTLVAAETVLTIVELPVIEDITAEDDTVILAAKEAYEELSEDQKKKVPQDTVNRLYASVTTVTVVEISDADGIDEDITGEDANKIKAAKEMYDDLTPEQQAMMPEDAVNKVLASAVTLDIVELTDTDEITIDDKTDILAAKEAFDALTPDQQDLIPQTKRDVLEASVTTVAIVEIPVATDIDEDITDEEANKIKAAKESYDDLTPEQQALVPEEVVNKVFASDTVLTIVELTDTDEISPEDKEAIEAARAKYDSLTGDQKDLIPSDIVDTLIASEAVLDIVELPVGTDITTEDKTDIQAAREAYKALTSEQKEKVPQDTVNTLIAAETTLMIVELPENKDITADDESKIVAAREAYEGLEDGPKAKVAQGTLDTLIAAETTLKIVKLPAIEKVTVGDKAAILAVKAEDEDEIVAARAAFNKLTDDQKKKVPQDTVDTLCAAEAVLGIVELPIGTDISEDDEDEIVAARAAYEELSEDQKKKVPQDTVDTLVAAETVLTIVELPVVGELTLEDKSDVVAARAAYDKLSDDQKKKVPQETVDALVAAETEIADIEAAKETTDVIVALPSSAETTREDREDVVAAREAYDNLTPYQQSKVPEETVAKLVAAEEIFVALDKIDAIGEVAYTPETKALIDSAKESYDGLSDEQKEAITNADKLQKADTDYNAVDEVVTKIDAITDIRYDERSGSAIEGARQEYSTLTTDQQAMLSASSYQKLVDAETVYETLGKIDAIGKVEYSEESKDLIDEAREYYDALSDEQKALINVQDVETLTVSEETYTEKDNSAKATYTALLVIIGVLLAAGLLVLAGMVYLQLKGKKKKGTKTFSVFFLPLLLGATHYIDSPFIALYVLAAVTLIVFVAIIVLAVKNPNLIKGLKNIFKKENKEEKVSEQEEKKAEPVAPIVVQEEPKQETPVAVATTAEEVSLAQDEGDEDGGVVVDAKGNYFNIRYNKSFTAKLIQSSDETKEYYGELKNEILSYAKTKSRVSWAYDSVNAGREAVAKFGVRGKTLCLYLPLKAEELDEKYKVEAIESAKYAAVPCMYRIKNERRLRYAKELIATACNALGLEKGETKGENYYLPFESTEALVKKNLVKELTVAATSTQIEKAKTEGTIRIVESVSVTEVNDLISTEIAAAAITESDTHATGKKGIVNVDTLSMQYNSGDTVTVESLHEKKLIAPGVKQVKLLARGKLDKALHIELQDYSIEAVKMILATGGTVKRC